MFYPSINVLYEVEGLQTCSLFASGSTGSSSLPNNKKFNDAKRLLKLKAKGMFSNCASNTISSSDNFFFRMLKYVKSACKICKFPDSSKKKSMINTRSLNYFSWTCKSNRSVPGLEADSVCRRLIYVWVMEITCCSNASWETFYHYIIIKLNQPCLIKPPFSLHV